MIAFLNVIIYQPLYNILLFFYSLIPDFGFAIILLTLFVRFALVPIYKKQLATQKTMQILQPKIKELNEKYKNDKERQTRELMELYKAHKANPFSGCLPIIVQMFFLFGIFRVLTNISQQSGLVSNFDKYSFIVSPEKINTLFLGFIDLASSNSIHLGTFFNDMSSIFLANPAHVFLAILAAVAQYFQTKMMMASQPVQKTTNDDSQQPDMAQMMNKQMLVIGPLLTLYMGIQFPAGLALYWLTGTLFMLIQQVLLEKKSKS